MSSVKELTGGTGDVNPQILTFDLRQEAADIEISESIRIPVPRFSSKGGRAIVFEVLWIDTIFVNVPQAPAVAQFLVGSLSTSTNTAASDANTFSVESLDTTQSLAASTSFQLTPTVLRKYFTDGAGHGFLIATDTITAEVGSQFTLALNLIVWKIGYRFKEIPLAEYIGIVQGQQRA